ncbi:MAG TPA: hypothetical protein VFI29_04695 [Hanamia sp.]|nr:hypothetical protein [Hanamia sp.]
MTQTYIIKPLEILETEDIKALVERLKEKSKICIISGAAKVGKTALAIKILCYLMKDNPKEFKPIVISLDNSVEYWQNLMQLNEEIFRYPFKDKSFGPSENSFRALGNICLNIDGELLNRNYNFIVIDGIGKCNEALNAHDFEILFNSVVYFAKHSKAIFFITCRTEQLSISHPELDQSRKEGLVELWDLERPEYLGGEIKEFGDTRLRIE